MELVTLGVVKLLIPGKIRFTTDPEPIQSSQYAQVLSCHSSINAIALSNQTRNLTSKTFKTLKTDIAITDSSRRTISSSTQKEVDITSSMPAGLQPVGSTKAPQGDGMSRKVSAYVSGISTFRAQQMYKQAHREKQLEIPSREDSAILTLVGDVRFHSELSTKDTVQHETLRRENKDGTPTCREKVTDTTHIGDSLARMTPFRDVLIIHKSCNRDIRHQTPTGEFKIHIRVDNKHVPTHGGTVKTLERDS